MWVIYLIHILIIAGIYCSRLYLGMHSLDQVTFGFGLGFYIHFCYRVYLEGVIDKFLRCLFLEKKRKYPLLILLIALHFLTVLISFLLLRFDKGKDEKAVVEWRKVIVEQMNKYFDKKLPEGKMIYNKVFEDGGIIALVFAIMYGALLNPHDFKTTIYKDLSYGVTYKYCTRKNLKRVLIFGVISGAMYLTFKFTINPNSIYLLFFLKMELFFLLEILLYMILLPYIFQKCDLVCETDFLVPKMTRPYANI